MSLRGAFCDEAILHRLKIASLKKQARNDTKLAHDVKDYTDIIRVICIYFFSSSALKSASRHHLCRWSCHLAAVVRRLIRWPLRAGTSTAPPRLPAGRRSLYKLPASLWLTFCSTHSMFNLFFIFGLIASLRLFSSVSMLDLSDEEILSP